MNWSDWLVIIIIVGFTFIGFRTGFIHSVFRLASFFVSAILAVKLYPFAAEFMKKTVLYTNIKQNIYNNLMQQQAQTVTANSQVQQAAAQNVINSLKLPGFLRSSVESGISGTIPNPSQLIDVSKIMDSISIALANVIISIISMVLLYLLIRVLFFFARFILDGIANIPVFKEINKAGGFVLGIVEGLLAVYLLFALFAIFGAMGNKNGISTAIQSSLFAHNFVNNNFIISWLF